MKCLVCCWERFVRCCNYLLRGASRHSGFAAEGAICFGWRISERGEICLFCERRQRWTCLKKERYEAHIVLQNNNNLYVCMMTKSRNLNPPPRTRAHTHTECHTEATGEHVLLDNSKQQLKVIKILEVTQTLQSSCTLKKAT